MVAGNNNESIDALAVSLNVSGAEAFEALNAEIVKSEELAESAAETYAGMSEDAQKAGAAVLQWARNMEVSLEEAVEGVTRFGNKWGFTRQQLTDFAVAYESQFAQMIVDSTNRVKQAAIDMGLELDENLTGIIEGQIQQTALMSGSLEELATNLEAVEGALGEGLNVALEEQQTEVAETDSEWQGLGSTFKDIAIQAAAGLGILTIIQKITAFIKEGVAASRDLAESTTRLGISVRAYQRAQGDAAPTIQQSLDFAKELSATYGGPLSKNVQAVADAMRVLGLQTRLPAEANFELVKSARALSEVLGESTLGIVEKLSNFVLTGYSDSLRSLGVVITDNEVEQAAYNQGINKTIDEMTEAELQTARYAAAMAELAPIVEDATAAQDTFAGRIAENEVAIDEIGQRIGALFLPLIAEAGDAMVFWASRIEQGVLPILTALVVGFDTIIISMKGWIAIQQEFGRQLLSGTFDLQAFKDIIAETGEEISQNAIDRINQFGNAIGQLDDAFGEGDGEFFPPETDENLKEIREEFEKTAEAIEDATLKMKQSVEDAERSLADKLEDITIRIARQRADLQKDLSRDLADISRDAAQDRLEAITEANVEEIRLREDHQRDIRDLENRYLFDLEDAVRERDARRVLELQRRFNLEKNKRETDFRVQERRNRESLQRQLADINLAEKEKRAQRIDAFNEELEDLKTQEERLRADAHRNFQRRLRDLQINFNRRLQLIGAGINAELLMQSRGLQSLYGLLNSAYGAGGFVEGFYQRYAAIVRQYGGAGSAQSPPVPDARKPGLPPKNSPGGQQILGAVRAFARGGSFVANSPTMFLAGEGRPESVSVTPFSQSTGAPIAGFRNGGGGSAIRVTVDLGEGLRGEIVDESLDAAANVIASIKQGSA